MRRGFLNAARPARSGAREVAPSSRSSPPPLEDPDDCTGQGTALPSSSVCAVHMSLRKDSDGEAMQCDPAGNDRQRMGVGWTSDVQGCSSASSAPVPSSVPAAGDVLMAQPEEPEGTSAAFPSGSDGDMNAPAAEEKRQKPAGSLEECLMLLHGRSDEQRLVGLLLATKFVSGADESAVRAIFDAVGFDFINRLCKSGRPAASGPAGRRTEGGLNVPEKQDAENLKQQEAFRHLALTLISAFCRLPEVSSSVHVIRKVPMFLDLIQFREGDGPVEDAYECLVVVAGASEEGLRAVQQSNALGLIASDLKSFGFDFRWIPLSIKLMVMLVNTAGEEAFCTHADALAASIPPFAKFFCCCQDELKFEVLQILGVLFASHASRAVRQRVASSDWSGASSIEPEWAKDVRSGLGEILNSRVAVSHRQLAVQVARGMVELMGEEWMLGPMKSSNRPDNKSPPAERFFLLVLATISVETSMLLDELAKSMSADFLASTEAQQEAFYKSLVLADCYTLLERVIEVTSRTSAQRDNVEQEGDEMAVDQQGAKTFASLSQQVLTDEILLKVLKIVDEVVGTILNFLGDAKNKKLAGSDVVLASVRAVGSYLAEAEGAHKEQVLQLLGFMLSVTAEDEERPVHAVRFLLPALTTISRESKGCKALVACSGHKKIVACLQALASSGGLQSEEVSAGSYTDDDQSAFHVAMVEACDVLLNIMNMSDDFPDLVDGKDILAFLPVLVRWCSKTDPASGVGGQMFAMGACTIAMTMRLSDEDTLVAFLKDMGKADTFGCMLSLLIRFLQHGQGVSARLVAGSMEDKDLWEVAVAACTSNVWTYPSLKQQIVAPGGFLESLCGSSSVTAAFLNESLEHPGLRLLLATAAGIMEGAEDGY